MKRAKRLVSLLLALVMVMAVLAACGGNTGTQGSPTATPSQSGATEKPVSEKTEKVVFYLITFNNIPDDYSQINAAINQYIAATYPDAKVELELKLFGPAEYADKINLAMQSGTQMDLFIPLGIQTFIANNQCLPLEDLIESYGKELNTILSKDIGGDVYAPLTKNGHIYGVPINKGMIITPTLTYDADMLAATGYSIDDINSIKDLTPVFAKIKELYPDVYPFAGTNQQDSSIMMILKGEQEMDSLSDTLNMGVVFGDSSQVVNLYDSEQFKEYIGIIRDWYNKGYLPKDMATSTTRASELISAGRLFSTWAGYGGNSIATTMSASTGRNIGGKWISPFYFTTGDAGLAMCVSSTTKVAEAAMKLLNIIYTDEFVINTILYGIENEDYVKVDEHHWAYPEGKDANTVSYTAALCTGVVGSESLQYQPVGVDYEDVLLKLKMNTEEKRSPFFGFSFDPSSVINEMTALQNAYNQYMPGLICGSLDPDVAIPEFNKALKELGIEKVIAAKQEQLNDWLAQKK